MSTVTAGELTPELINHYGSMGAESLLAEEPEFFEQHGAARLGDIALAAFEMQNVELLDVISQHAFTTVMDSVRDIDRVQDFLGLYGKTEEYINSLANRGDS